MARKADLNFLVDVLAFVAFVILTATGLLVRYVLPPGSGHSRSLWGMDRHEWGELHFWIAVALLACLALHLLLHWRWVVSMVKGRPREGSSFRVALSFVGLLALVALVVAPFLVPVEQSSEKGEPPHRQRSADPEERGEHSIKGSMTLDQVQEATGVSADLILQDLGLPSDVPKDEQLGRLRRAYGFEMNEVREAVAKRAAER
jgi:hypothetical protein